MRHLSCFTKFYVSQDKWTFQRKLCNRSTCLIVVLWSVRDWNNKPFCIFVFAKLWLTHKNKPAVLKKEAVLLPGWKCVYPLLTHSPAWQYLNVFPLLYTDIFKNMFFAVDTAYTYIKTYIRIYEWGPETDHYKSRQKQKLSDLVALWFS